MRYYMVMDLEELNKSQIVLLTLLVSFVTSIATGIVTVSLIEETPKDVTRVVQRVVERTVEQVNPAAQEATVITREKTVIVREADLIAAAIAENKTRIVSVVEAQTGSFVALGIFIDSSGTLATDASTLDGETEYAIDVGAEDFVPADVLYAGGARGIALLKVSNGNSGVAAVVASDLSVQLGQTLVAFIGGGSITQGIATEVKDGGYIGTNISGIEIAPGAPVINVDGEVVGISTGASRKVGSGSFAPIRAALAAASPPDEPETPQDSTDTTATSTQTAAQ